MWVYKHVLKLLLCPVWAEELCFDPLLFQFGFDIKGKTGCCAVADCGDCMRGVAHPAVYTLLSKVFRNQVNPFCF